MEISVAKMPKFLRNDVLKERKELIENGDIDENVADIFHKFSEGLQVRLLDFAEGFKKGQVHGMGDEFELPEYKGYEAPTDERGRIESVRLAFTSGTQGSRIAPAETTREAEEAKLAQNRSLSHKKDKETEAREAVVSAFTSRPVVNETNES